MFQLCNAAPWQVVGKPRKLNFTKADVTRAFSMFAEEPVDPEAPKTCIDPDMLAAVLVSWTNPLGEESRVITLCRLLNNIKLIELPM